jgi:glycosyltransferase involved in cell wall biosynthesis
MTDAAVNSETKNAPPDLLFVAAHAPGSEGWGGVVRSVHAYLRAAEILGYQRSMIASSASLGGAVEKEKVQRLVPGARVRLYRAWGPGKWAIGPGLFLHIARLISADLVVIHGVRVFPLVIAAVIRATFRRPYVVVTHSGLDQLRHEQLRARWALLFPIYRAVTLWTIQSADVVIVSGPVERRQLDKWVPTDHVIDVENFFDFEPSRPFCLPNSTKDYIFVGRISPDKGILSFLRVWLRAASPKSRLRIVGSGESDYADEVRRMANCDSRVSLYGELPSQEVYDLIKRSAILVLPTGMDEQVVENFGNVIVEALICGRPVMVSRRLHWDEYAGRSFIIRFETNANDVVTKIRDFERLNAEAYAAIAQGAYDFAARFHVGNASDRIGIVFNAVVARAKARK